MTEDMIPMAMIIAALCGGLAGLFALVSWRACGIALGVAFVGNIVGCAAFGYHLNIERGATFTPGQILAGFALTLPGFVVYVGLPSVVVGLIVAAASRFLRDRLGALARR